MIIPSDANFIQEQVTISEIQASPVYETLIEDVIPTAAMAAGGGLALKMAMRSPGMVIRGWNYANTAILAAWAYQGLVPGVKGELGWNDTHQLGIEFGTDSTMPLGAVPIYGRYAPPYARKYQVPTFGLQIGSVKKSPSPSRSKSSQPTVRFRRVKKTRWGKGTTKSKRPTPVMMRRRGKRCRNGYRYDPIKRVCLRIS